MKDTLGGIIGMGLLCGTFGIYVAHELGHKVMHQQMRKYRLLPTD